jgi:hypothetical protein
MRRAAERGAGIGPRTPARQVGGILTEPRLDRSAGRRPGGSSWFALRSRDRGPDPVARCRSRQELANFGQTLAPGWLVEARTPVRASVLVSRPRLRRGLGGSLPQVKHSARRFGSAEPICAEGARRGLAYRGVRSARRPGVRVPYNGAYDPRRPLTQKKRGPRPRFRNRSVPRLTSWRQAPPWTHGPCRPSPSRP